ncbi:DUF2339 domain-containing protein [Mobilicoccus massiliensis]|uniref:DUF2339 domain-containing protein n=1 Tax=Mobilicoccus massiliensis TaxID=1522310 RepID=UPI000B01F51A|nr:DUF2339 domain-containing protein [Mobilicoccus massiliensis]
MLAIGGAVVTILGVGFLLAVAIAAGLFGPVPRVVALAVLSVILGLVAGRMHARRSSDAAVALAATSSAAAFAAVVATTAIYAWLPAFAGLVLALLLAGAGVFVAHRWRSQVLAGLEYVQMILVLPMILQPATDIAFVEFSVFAAIAYVPVVVAVVEHRWLPLFRVASLGLGAVAFIGLIGGTAGSAGGTVRVLTSIVVFLLIAACATALTEVAVLGTALGLSAIAILWLRDETALLGLELTAPVAGAVALATAIAAVRYRGAIRTMLTIGAVTHLLVATLALPVSDHVVAVLLAFEALVLVVAARQRASLPMWGASIAFTLAAIAGLIVLVPVPAVFSTSAVAHATRWEAVVVGLLLAGVGAAHVLSVRDIRVPRIDPAARVLAGLAVGLYGASSAIVAVGLLPGASEVQAMAANVVTTIVWVAVAVGMILRPASPVTRAGYALLIAAIAKLFLADLHTVDGVLRAVLFVLTGLALIGASSQIRKHTDAGTGDGRGDDGPAVDGIEEASTDALRED